MIESNKIYNEDCLEGIKRIPDGSVDMILYRFFNNYKHVTINEKTNNAIDI